MINNPTNAIVNAFAGAGTQESTTPLKSCFNPTVQRLSPPSVNAIGIPAMKTDRKILSAMEGWRTRGFDGMSPARAENRESLTPVTVLILFLTAQVNLNQ